MPEYFQNALYHTPPWALLLKPTLLLTLLFAAVVVVKAVTIGTRACGKVIFILLHYWKRQTRVHHWSTSWGTTRQVWYLHHRNTEQMHLCDRGSCNGQFKYKSPNGTLKWLFSRRFLSNPFVPLSLWNSSLETPSAQPSKYFCSVSTCLHRMSLNVSISASFSRRLWPFWSNTTHKQTQGFTVTCENNSTIMHWEWMGGLTTSGFSNPGPSSSKMV